MRAIVFSANRLPSQIAGLACSDLSPLVDRPFLQHVVECIVGQGIRQIEFVLPEEHLATEFLGEGVRWGAQFRYSFTAKDTGYEALARVAPMDSDEAVLIAHSDRLPAIRLVRGALAPTLFCWGGAQMLWTGWGVVRAADTRRIPPGLDEKGLFKYFLNASDGTVCEEGPQPLNARTYADLIESTRRVLAREFPGVLVGGKEVQPGVWVARNVALHPTARVEPPAFVGENSRVGPLVQVGPSASIGRHCMIERETVVSDSVVFAGSYVGQKLSLKGVVVDRSRFASARWGVEIEGMDDLVLGSVFSAPLGARMRRGSRRAVAAFLLLAAAPCLGLLVAASFAELVPPLRRRWIIRTPTISDSNRWKTYALWSFGTVGPPSGAHGWAKHFFYGFLPALPAIVAGHLGFVGTSPQTREDAESDAASAHFAHLRRHPGIVSRDSMRTALPGKACVNAEANGGRTRDTIAVLWSYSGLALRDLFFRKRRSAE